MSRVKCVAVLAAGLAALGAASLACGGYDPATVFPPVDCCVANNHYSCGNATAAGRCLSTPPDPNGCSLQTTACPVAGTR
jgi:hypothetical protein